MQMELGKLKEKQRWIHVLPDMLTAKTTSELRLELAILGEMVTVGESLDERLQLLHSQALTHSSSGGFSSWEHLMEQLASLDFQPLQESYITVEHSFK